MSGNRKASEHWDLLQEVWPFEPPPESPAVPYECIHCERQQQAGDFLIDKDGLVLCGYADCEGTALDLVRSDRGQP